MLLINIKRLLSFGILMLLLNACTTSPPDYQTLSNPYVRGDGGWGQLPDGLSWGASSAIHYAGNNKVWVAYRCGGNRGPGSCDDLINIDPILLFDAGGELLQKFGAGLLVWPHGIYVDDEGNLWLTDAATSSISRKGNQVHKFSPDGELLMSLGIAGVQGTGHYFFNAPNDVLVAPNGDIFVADGHSARTDNRIVKFNSAGEYLMEWGTVGSADGEFRVPHALAMDSLGRLFVADRGNSRLQIFDQKGKHLDTWMQFGRPSDLYIDGNDVLYSADSESNTGSDRNPGWQRGIYIGNALTGELTAYIPDPEINPARTTSHAEGITADAVGNLYGAEVTEKNVRKWILDVTEEK